MLKVHVFGQGPILWQVDAGGEAVMGKPSTLHQTECKEERRTTILFFHQPFSKVFIDEELHHSFFPVVSP